MAYNFSGGFQTGVGGLSTVLDNAIVALPQILMAVFFVLLGFGLGNLIKWIIVKLSKVTKFSELASRTGTDEAVKKIGYPGKTPNLMGDVFKWVVYFAFFGAAIQVLFGEELLSEAILAIAVYVPKIVIAIVVLIGGLMISDIFGKFMRRIIEKTILRGKDRTTIATIAEILTKTLILIVAAVIALSMIGLYVEILTIGFGITFFAIVLFILVGSRNLLLNVFAGLYLQSSTHINKGSTIKVGDLQGEVIEVGTVYTILKVKQGEVQIPNNLLLKEKSAIIE